MSNESINDKAVSTLAMVKDVDRAMDGVNDYSQETGFRDEHDQIVNDFHYALGSIRSRMSKLMRRLEKHQATRKPKDVQ